MITGLDNDMELPAPDSATEDAIRAAAAEALMPVVQRRLVLRADFERGYFCAVAVYLKESCQEGVADTMAKSLFGQGGDWRKADPEDIETFRIHGLIPAENDQVL